MGSADPQGEEMDKQIQQLLASVGLTAGWMMQDKVVLACKFCWKERRVLSTTF